MTGFTEQVLNAVGRGEGGEAWDESKMMGVCIADRDVSEIAHDLEESLALLTHFAPALSGGDVLRLKELQGRAQDIQTRRRGERSIEVACAALQTFCAAQNASHNTHLYQAGSHWSAEGSAVAADVLVCVPAADYTTTSEVLLESLVGWGVTGGGQEGSRLCPVGTGGAGGGRGHVRGPYRGIILQWVRPRRQDCPSSRRRGQVRERALIESLQQAGCVDVEVRRVEVREVWERMGGAYADRLTD